jgi:hypothetical protein
VADLRGTVAASFPLAGEQLLARVDPCVFLEVTALSGAVVAAGPPTGELLLAHKSASGCHPCRSAVAHAATKLGRAGGLVGSAAPLSTGWWVRAHIQRRWPCCVLGVS